MAPPMGTRKFLSKLDTTASTVPVLIASASIAALLLHCSPKALLTTWETLWAAQICAICTTLS